MPHPGLEFAEVDLDLFKELHSLGSFPRADRSILVIHERGDNNILKSTKSGTSWALKLMALGHLGAFVLCSPYATT